MHKKLQHMQSSALHSQNILLDKKLMNAFAGRKKRKEIGLVKVLKKRTRGYDQVVIEENKYIFEWIDNCFSTENQIWFN